jgi:aryl-alcohol dehydrogenase-like predicted oxidoreductase
MCRDEGMGLLPYGTLGQGRFHTETDFKEREKNNPGRKSKPINEHDRAVSKVREKVAKAKGTVITSVALPYIRQQTPYVFPIVGCRQVNHLKGNIAALCVTLSEDDLKEIDKAYAFDPGFPHTFPSGTLFSSASPEGAKGPTDV